MRAKKTVTSLASALILATALTAPSVDAAASTASASRRHAPYCQDQDMILKPESAYPHTPIGHANFMLQNSRMEAAVLCLVNGLRQANGLPGLKIYLLLPGMQRGIRGAAYDHAQAAVKMRWWGAVGQVPANMCPYWPDKPQRCNPHINPVTHTTPDDRAKANGFGKGCTKYWDAENTYTGWGSDYVTPIAAYRAWETSPGHRANMLDPNFQQMALRAELGSADPAAGTTSPAATYVQTFGGCQR
ncbi:CAP domain-containing protein [Streptomyces sp. NPDC096136]|uniref:CAP domain-containing protein n=1 Tax=Streptomyces sp. NPDC096136 TaxID=3366076 RepID=UPI0038065583